MDNLSGGEKTVAALALLFSIHRYCTSIKFRHLHLSRKGYFPQWCSSKVYL